MDYNSNLKEILETKEIYNINLDKTFEMLSEQYYSGELVKKVIEGYTIFCKFYRLRERSLSCQSYMER
ncbi:protein of unknown function [Petrocella atlantisensis]|uniref:Uncharacterized protein n=1 Tax=Petrocella atlantisensis TaxID=2173034 RepID=A0A3P7P1J4_9FIRM|nr:protein of unknown function [Petrocella atlantisensis]